MAKRNALSGRHWTSGHTPKRTPTHGKGQPTCLYGRITTIIRVLTRLLARNLRLQSWSEGEQRVDTLHLDAIGDRSEDLTEQLTILQKYIKHGVSSNFQVSICENLFDDRIIAKQLDEMFGKNYEPRIKFREYISQNGAIFWKSWKFILNTFHINCAYILETVQIKMTGPGFLYQAKS